MTREDTNASLRFSEAAVSLMLGRAIAEGLSDVVRQPLPQAVVDLLNELDKAPGREATRLPEGCARPADDHSG